MLKIALFVASAVLAAATGTAQAEERVANKMVQLSYCVPVLDFAEPPPCVGIYTIPVIRGVVLIRPVPFPASAHQFVPDDISAKWRL